MPLKGMKKGRKSGEISERKGRSKGTTGWDGWIMGSNLFLATQAARFVFYWSALLRPGLSLARDASSSWDQLREERPS